MKGLDIARTRMRNSRLVGPPFDASDDAVRWHGAMQAQDYGPAKWSIGQRTASILDEDLDHALATGSIIRTHVLRPTWHFVTRADIRWLLALTGPRVQRHIGPRYRELELDERTLSRCEAVIVSALEGGHHLTRNDIGGVLDRAKIDRTGQRLPHILMHCELEAVICSGSLAGKQHTYSLLDERVAAGHRFDRDQALVELTRRYLASHGPATVQDLRWWSSLTVADIKNALHMLGPDVQSETIEGITLWSITADEAGSPNATGAHLLQTFDELIVGYTQSRFLGDPRAADARAAWRDRGAPRGVVVLRGRVAGHWRRSLEKDSVRVEVVMYERPNRNEIRSLRSAAEDLGRFLGRPEILDVSERMS